MGQYVLERNTTTFFITLGEGMPQARLRGRNATGYRLTVTLRYKTDFSPTSRERIPLTPVSPYGGNSNGFSLTARE